MDSLCHPWFTTTNLSYSIGFLFLKLPPPPCAVLLEICVCDHDICMYVFVCIKKIIHIYIYMGMSQIEVPFSSKYKILGDKNQSQKKQRHVFFGDIHICIYIYMVVDQNSFIPEWPFFANKKLLSRNFRELHVYLWRGPCWPTTPLMKIRSPPAKLRQRITDHFLVAF